MAPARDPDAAAIAAEAPATPSEVRLARSLFGNPKTRPGMQKLIRELHPEADLPELDARAAVADARAATDRATKAAERLENDAVTRRLEDERAKVVAAGLATREEIPAIEKLMQDVPMGDHMAAARYHRTLTAPAAPTTTSRGSYVMPGKDGSAFFKGLFTGNFDDATKWAAERAYKDVADLRAGRPLDPAPLG